MAEYTFKQYGESIAVTTKKIKPSFLRRLEKMAEKQTKKNVRLLKRNLYDKNP
jgi:hypothetical protein